MQMDVQRTAKFWNKNADGYAKSKIGDMAAYEYTLERSISYMKETDRVLELGCGTGMSAVRFAPHVAEFIGSDVSDGMLEHCRARAEEAGLDNLRFQEAMVGDDSFKGQQFDIVMAHSLLHLLPDLEKRLSDIRDLLKPGGLFISKTVCLSEGKGLKARAIRMVIPAMQMVGKAPYVNALSVADLEAMMTWSGFKIIESGNFPQKTPPARYLVARRI